MKTKNIFLIFLDHLFLFRIPLLAPVWTVFLLGASFGIEKGCTPINNSSITMLIGFSFLVGGIYILNQIFDVKSDLINNKLFILPKKLVKTKTAWIMAVLSLTLPIVYAFYKNTNLGIIFLLSACAGIVYNSTPFELKNRPIGGLISNMFGHGFLTFIAGWLSINSYKQDMLIPAIAISFANGAVYLCTTIPDATGDKKTGKKTFAVYFGEKTTAISAFLLEFGTFICSIFILNSIFGFPQKWIILFTSFVSLPFYIIIMFSQKSKYVFRAFKIPVFILSCCVIYTTWWYGILIVFTFWGSRIYYKKRFNKNYPTFKSE